MNQSISIKVRCSSVACASPCTCIPALRVPAPTIRSADTRGICLRPTSALLQRLACRSVRRASAAACVTRQRLLYRRAKLQRHQRCRLYAQPHTELSRPQLRVSKVRRLPGVALRGVPDHRVSPLFVRVRGAGAVASGANAAIPSAVFPAHCNTLHSCILWLSSSANLQRNWP